MWVKGYINDLFLFDNENNNYGFLFSENHVPNSVRTFQI